MELRYEIKAKNVNPKIPYIPKQFSLISNNLLIIIPYPIIENDSK
tara:strand:- start:667 stop:801 length:135 start_codon:yes stop_codon:yes gene_type:complete